MEARALRAGAKVGGLLEDLVGGVLGAATGDLSMSTLGKLDILISKPIEVSGTGMATPPCGGMPGG